MPRRELFVIVADSQLQRLMVERMANASEITAVLTYRHDLQDLEWRVELEGESVARVRSFIGSRVLLSRIPGGKTP